MTSNNYLQKETADVNNLTRSLKKAIRTKNEYNNAQSSRTMSISEQIILDALGGAGT